MRSQLLAVSARWRATAQLGRVRPILPAEHSAPGASRGTVIFLYRRAVSDTDSEVA
jgi:hypothetical protein